MPKDQVRPMRKLRAVSRPWAALVDRRHFLRGLGAVLGLPWLESMQSSLSLAGESSAAPCRLAFLYIPNGAHMPHWTPAEVGPLRELPETFAELSDLRSELLFISGLRLRGAEPQGDGPGDHARSMAAFLTGAHPRKTDGADIKNGISVDQIAAKQMRGITRFPSLELGLEAGLVAGSCDSGYSCAYSSNLAWSSESTPLPKDTDPRSVFDRLFGDGSPGMNAARRARQEMKKSILDFARHEARALHSVLSAADRRKLDEYLDSVRDVEQRLFSTDRADPQLDDHTMARLGQKPVDYGEYARLMLDLLVLALQTDSTRIATFVFANEGSNLNYPELGISEGHHEISHHDGQPDKIEKIASINRYHTSLYGSFVRRLRDLREGNSSLLDQTLILYGSGIHDGNRHNHDDLPIVLAGRLAGQIKTGRHLQAPVGTPLTNLYVSLLERFGSPVPQVADSTGPLAGV